MRDRLSGLGIACPRWARATTAADVTAFGEDVGWPIIAKTPRGGYDGKGVAVASSADDLAEWISRIGQPGPLEGGLLARGEGRLRRELAVLIARSPSGQAAAWPVVETVQTDGICTEVARARARARPRPRLRGHRGGPAHRR